jgi:outer membrane lipoprotein-sorting protein
MRGVLVLVLSTVFTLGGCAANREPQLPAYTWVDSDTALRDLRARSAAVENVSAACDVTLGRPDGETVQLDGAMVMRNPGYVRLRAWKFNRAVFDLTLTPEGLWVMTMDDPARREQVLPASVNAADFMRQWSYLNGKLFQEADANDVTVNGDTVVVVGRTADNSESAATLRCEVDRRTLTPRRYVYEDSGRKFELKMERYQQIDGVAWPTRLVARGDVGSVVIQQRDVEINHELAPQAFVPPRRAEKRQ